MLQMYRQADHKARMTLIGVCLMKFAGGLALIWGTCNVYFFSYLKHQGEAIDSKTNSKLLLWALVPLILTVPLANPFARWVGYRTAIRSCAIVFLLSPLVINFKLSTITFALFWMVMPLSCFCLAAIPLINCLWTQFPKDLNKVSGIVILTSSVGMITWNLLFMMLVNPDNTMAQIDSSGMPIFPLQISDNIFKASNTVFLIAGLFNIAGSFLVSRRVIANLEEPVNPHRTSVTKIPDADVLVSIQRAVSNASADNERIATLKQGLQDKRFILTFFISGLNPIFLVYLMQNIKLVYMPIINDDHFLSFCSVIVTISAIVGAPLWGYLGDIKGFKTTLLLIVIADTFVKLFGVYSGTRWSLALLFFFLGANDRGLLTVIGPGLVGMFGIEMATELIPYKGLAHIISYSAAPIIQIFLFQLSHTSLLFIFVGCSLLAVFLSAYLKFKVHYKEINPAEDQQELKDIRNQKEYYT